MHAVPIGGKPGCDEVTVGRCSAGDTAAVGERAAVDEVAVGADEPVVIASIFKVLLVLEFARQVAAGQLDPRARVRVTAVTGSVAGVRPVVRTMSNCPCATWPSSRSR